jgi:hypothetical protein
VKTMLKVNNAYPHKKGAESTKDNYALCKTHMNSINNTQMSSNNKVRISRNNLHTALVLNIDLGCHLSSHKF